MAHSSSSVQMLSGVIDQMFVSPQNSYVEILTPNAMVLGGGAFGK